MAMFGVGHRIAMVAVAHSRLPARRIVMFAVGHRVWVGVASRAAMARRI